MSKQPAISNRGQRGFSLIVVVFAMMLLAVLGYSLMSFLGGDLDMGLRSLASERAFYLTESGDEWALTQLLANASWNTSVDRDCNHTGEWRTYNLTGGQYQVCCRGAQITEDASAVLEVNGYSPSATNYLAMRKTKALVKLGTMSAAVQAKNLFNWSATTSGTYVNGEIISGHYEGTDADHLPDEPEDYNVPGNGNRTFAVAGTYPQIDMDYFLNNATYVWNLARESNITRISGSDITVADPIFTTGSTWDHEVAVRNLWIGGWGDDSWREITNRRNTTTVTLAATVPTWVVGQRIRTCRRYYQDPSGSDRGIHYIRGDTLIDVRNIDFTPSGGFYLISEGDIAIRGTGDVSMRGQSGTTMEPSLATKDGNIISPDVPQHHNSNQIDTSRNFEGIIYSENGDVSFNYLNTANSTLGNNVILKGEVHISMQGRGRGRWRRWWRRRIGGSGGFDFEPVVIQWKEQ
jgi:Tfp pilus assembly protein PilV